MEIKMIRYLIYIVLSLTLTSCASFNAPLDYRLDEKSNRGLVVFSFTTEGILENFFLQYQNEDGTEKGDVTLWTNRNPLDWASKEKGRLVILELPQGKYDIFRLVAPLQVSSKDRFSIPFEVTSGKVAYLGNVHISIPDQENFTYVLRDKSERDLEMLFSRYTKISKDDLIKIIKE
ncbi:TPA: hypothetical protein ACN3ZO_003779 [Vibrio cholerae]